MQPRPNTEPQMVRPLEAADLYHVAHETEKALGFSLSWAPAGRQGTCFDWRDDQAVVFAMDLVDRLNARISGGAQ